MSDEFLPANEALDRLCNAECIIQVVVQHLDGKIRESVDPWQVSEALQGALRLLDGCYVSLNEQLSKSSERAAP